MTSMASSINSSGRARAQQGVLAPGPALMRAALQAIYGTGTVRVRR